MSEKKMISRNVAIGLGIVCIILAASLAEAFSVLNGANQQNTDLQNQNRQLQSWLDGNVTLLNQTQEKNTDLENIVNLNESEVVWTENNVHYLVNLDSIQLVLGPYKYAGYLLVEISATSDTSIELRYTFQSMNYTSQVNCNMNGTAIFPVLPYPLSSVLTVRLYITVPHDAWTANWTWTYYY
jgi:hypothetical protein